MDAPRAAKAGGVRPELQAYASLACARAVSPVVTASPAAPGGRAVPPPFLVGRA